MGPPSYMRFVVDRNVVMRRIVVCLGLRKNPAQSGQDIQLLAKRLTWNVEASWTVMVHAQKPDFVFRRNGRVHLIGGGRQFSRILAADVCASAVVMLDTPCSEVVWRVLATHSIGQFPPHFPSRASPCAITFQLESTDYEFAVTHWPRRSVLTLVVSILSE